MPFLVRKNSAPGIQHEGAGNEFIFQMMAYQNIQTLNQYNIKKIVTTCPHCFNIFKNEYPKLGWEL